MAATKIDLHISGEEPGRGGEVSFEPLASGRARGSSIDSIGSLLQLPSFADEAAQDLYY